MGILTLRNLAKSEASLRGCHLRKHEIADTTRNTDYMSHSKTKKARNISLRSLRGIIY